MKLPDFLTEQWMNDYENDAVYNLTDTCVKAYTFEELLQMDKDHLLNSVTMDYGTITGRKELKEEILKLYTTGCCEDITTAQGCLQANELVMNTMLSAGDRVVAFTPGYQQFTDLPRSLGCIVDEVHLIEENSWLPDPEELAAVLAQPFRMIILNNPNNPTGTQFSGTILQTMIDAARKYDAYILSDEVYRGRKEEEPSVSDLYEHGISTCSLSKMYSLAGLRFGWIKGDPEVVHAVNVRRDYSIISTGPLADTMALIALQNQKAILERSRRITDRSRRIIREWLKDEPLASVVMPDYGTVCFLKYSKEIASTDLALKLLKESGVFFVPGSCFDCEYHLRLGLTAEEDKLRQGLNLLSSELHGNGSQLFKKTVD